MTEDSADDNVVFLRGRLAAGATSKELPSGDVLAVFRLIVDRPRPTGKIRVDNLDCVSTRARVRRSLERAEPGDVLEVTGSVQRRFWRGQTGPQSRYSIDVVTVRVSRAARPAAASRARKQASA